MVTHIYAIFLRTEMSSHICINQKYNKSALKTKFFSVYRVYSKHTQGGSLVNI